MLAYVYFLLEDESINAGSFIPFPLCIVILILCQCSFKIVVSSLFKFCCANQIYCLGVGRSIQP